MHTLSLESFAQNDTLQVYGGDQEPLRRLNALLAPVLDELTSWQAGNLALLCSPELTQEQHRERSLEMGRAHAIAGPAQEDLGQSYDRLLALVRQRVDAIEHAAGLSVLGRRIMRDMAWRLEASQQLQARRNEVLLEITRIVWQQKSYSELIGRITEILINHDEIDGCVFTRPNAQGITEVEMMAGQGMTELMSRVRAMQSSLLLAGASPLSLQGPSMRAWRSQNIERSADFATDEEMPAWRDIFLQAGLRSNVAIPLLTQGAAPSVLLTLFSRYPGGFASPEQSAFVSQLQTLLMFALAWIESLRGSASTIPYSTRRRWVGLLQEGGLEMHYQPIVDLRTGRATKVEALARLRDGERVLSPPQFFPALSCDDFLTLYVEGLNQILRQKARWTQAGIALDLSINLPTAALQDERYFEATAWALLQHNCPPAELMLEILESGDAAPGHTATEALEHYRELGVKLAEDDLGAGYSSLARLREMPFDMIKIDRSIVNRVEQDPSSVLRFIYQLTRLGHTLGKTVIVEGVEHIDLLEAIAVLGTDGVQGYAIAQPMPAQELERWIGQPRHMPEFEPDAPRGVWARLAHLLIWEEGLNLVLGSVTRRTSREAMLRDLCDNILALFPAGSWTYRAQTELAELAVEYGLRSHEYKQARSRMVQMLMEQ